MSCFSRNLAKFLDEDDRTYTTIMYYRLALMRNVHPKSQSTFSEYNNSVWQDHIIKNLTKHGVHHVDIVKKTVRALSTKLHTIIDRIQKACATK